MQHTHSAIANDVSFRTALWQNKTPLFMRGGHTALKTIFITCCIILTLCIPIVVYRAEQNLNNDLVLQSRWQLAFFIVLLGGLIRAVIEMSALWRLRVCFAVSFFCTIFAVCIALYLGDTSTDVVLLSYKYGLIFSAFFFLSAGLIFLSNFYSAYIKSLPLEAQTGKLSQNHTWLRIRQMLPSVFVGFLLIFPLVALSMVGWQGALKLMDNFGIQILIYIMLGLGLNIVVGLAGLLDLGYVAFYAVGAYSYALLAKEFGMSFWILLPLAGILAGFCGLLLGFPVLRLRGDYLAIVTLAFGEMIRLVLINWIEFSGGYAGISSIPRPTFFGIPFNASETGFAARFGLEFTPLYRTIFLYYLILGLTLLTAYVVWRLRKLPIGRAWEALREDEIACRALGINITNTKLTAFAIGAMFGGFAGAFFAARQGFVSPASFTFLESAMILAVVVLGGMGSVFGVAIAAIVLIGGTELLREMDALKLIFGSDFDPTQYRMLLFGAVMVLVMLWKPRGLISTREPTVVLHEQKSISQNYVKEGHG
jgi:branched-chain amino acid transport system permease protein